jgi:hypothetical protein
MSNELAHKPLDGFAGYADASEGEDEQSSGSLIVGTKIKFDNAQVWVDGNGENLPAGLELVLVKVLRVVQKWGPDNKPIEEHTRILEPHDKWPDLDALNAICPESEWREVFGKMQGPWEGQRLVYLVDQQTMARYTWPSPQNTIGSRICVNDIVDRTNWMRRFRGALVYPVVELSDTFMRTSYGGARGGRQRPNFIVKRWIAFNDDPTLPTAEIKSLPEPTTVADPPSKTAVTLEQFAKAEEKPSQKSETAGMKTVNEPSAKEVTGDEIVF